MAKKAPASDPARLSKPKDRGTLDKRVQARSFLGKKNLATVDGMPVLYGPTITKKPTKAPPKKLTGGLPNFSAAAMHSASLAHSMRPESHGDDALAEYRRSSLWQAPSIVAALAPISGEQAKAADPNLVAMARALLCIAMMGEAKGIRLLGEALERSPLLDADTQRKAAGVSRMAGTRSLTAEQVLSLVPMLIQVAPQAGPILDRCAAVVSLGESAHPLGRRARGLLSPRQLLELPRQHACLVLPEGEATKQQAVMPMVGLLRGVEGELIMVDPDGLFDPVRGIHDGHTHLNGLPSVQEVALQDHLAGQPATPPVSPTARLIYGCYRSGGLPEDLALAQVQVVGGLVYKYC